MILRSGKGNSTRPRSSEHLIINGVDAGTSRRKLANLVPSKMGLARWEL